jgi:hypothetical protein
MSPTTPRRRRIVLFLSAIAALGFTGCSTPTTRGVVETGPNHYSVTIQQKSGMFANDKPGDLKTQAISQAMEFAEARGKIAAPVTFTQHAYGIFGDWVKVEYEFKLVDKNAPGSRGTVAFADAADKPDVYAQLLKLDDLRKRGIITQAEFDTQKQKLLAGAK